MPGIRRASSDHWWCGVFHYDLSFFELRQSFIGQTRDGNVQAEAEAIMRVTRLGSVILGFSVMLIVGCGGGMGMTPPGSACMPAAQSSFTYVLSGNPAGAVSMFTVNSCTGALTPLTPATVPTGIEPESMVVDPSGKFVYVANLVSNASDQATISMFTVDPTSGVLTPTTPATVPTGFFPQGIGIDHASKFVYTANSDDNTLSMFTINPTTGVLTPTTPPTVATGQSPLSVTVHPSGKFAYAANQDDDTISMYTVNPNTGVLTPMTPATVSTGASPFGVTIDPSGKFAYVPNAYDPNNSVSQYTIDADTGVLTPNAQITATVQANPTAVAIDPSGRFAYVVNRGADSVSMFSIDASTGTLTPNGLNTVFTGNQPFRIAVDPSGKFVYVVNENDATVSIYSVNADGTLTNAGTAMAALSPLDVGVTFGK
jgi:6-phosphogluconolactonase